MTDKNISEKRSEIIPAKSPPPPKPPTKKTDKPVKK